MSGHRPFSELTKDFTQERRERIAAEKAKLLADMPLHDLRRARDLTQQGLARALKVNQPAIARMERGADVYVSNLRSHIEAMGGQLKITAEFPQGDIAITNFSNVVTLKKPRRKRRSAPKGSLSFLGNSPGAEGTVHKA